MKNQKFEIVVQDKIAYLKVIPPENAGKRVDVQQVVYFLSHENLNEYNWRYIWN